MNTNQTRSKLLIVDDEPINVQMLGQALSADYDILMATDGKTALGIAESQRPDLILLDIMMPEMDGFEVCRALKQDRRTMNIPIVFSTAMDDDDDEVKGLEMGAVDYIIKPFNMALVRARIRNQVQLKKKTDLLEQLISIDGLTEIPNRRYFDDMFEQEWRRAERSQQPISVCILDIDHFKQFNDNYGHASGDDCLIKVAQTLQNQVQRSGDFVARYGGEEFVFVWPGTENTDAIRLAEKARYAVAGLFIPHNHSSCADHITISIGVASAVPDSHDSFKSLLKLADQRLYMAKEQGRNRVVGGDD